MYNEIVKSDKKKLPNKLEKNGVERNEDGTVKAGSVLNPNGRPKRKTLTEMIHARLDDDDSWKDVVGVVLEKVLKDKDKDILKALWEHTDGKPKQAVQLGGDDDNPLKLELGNTLTELIEKSYGKHRPGDSGEGS